jgi:CubicO group peptidase (beta-lactamase class C family)
MSTTKSLMSILIGIALQEGFLNNLNQTLYEFFANIWEPSFRDSELKKNITIEQLLTHNSGLGDSPSYLLIESDCIKYALDLISLEFTPGEAGEFSYSNDGVNLLSGIISNVTGKTTEEFAQEYLFTPLGISEDEYYWWRDQQGMRYGAYGFDCTPKVQAKLGILCLNNGTWNGTQILDEEYMKEATTPKIDLIGVMAMVMVIYLTRCLFLMRDIMHMGLEDSVSMFYQNTILRLVLLLIQIMCLMKHCYHNILSNLLRITHLNGIKYLKIN